VLEEALDVLGRHEDGLGCTALHVLLPGHVPVGIAQEESEFGARLPLVSGLQRCGIPPAVVR